MTPKPPLPPVASYIWRIDPSLCVLFYLGAQAPGGARVAGQAQKAHALSLTSMASPSTS